MDYIQSKVEEILYHYVGISKPVKKEKNPEESLEIETDLLPTDLELEQVSPDSDKKSSLSDGLNMDEMKDEEVEEEIVEDDDFESPAFEPIEASVDRNEQSQHSNLSAISGLTSQDSVENKSDPTSSDVKEQNQPQDTQLSQISSIQDMDMSQEAPESAPAIDALPEEAQPTTSSDEKLEPMIEEPEKSQFDLKKDSIEFTGNERKSITTDDSTTSCDAEKVLQPEDVPSNTMEIDNLYENDTTDSSEMRMEIDLKDETTQETGGSQKIEESSQDSSLSKEKRLEQKKDSHHHRHKSSDRSRDKHKSSSSHKSSHHSRSSSSKPRLDDKHKSRSDGKSRSSNSHKKSSNEKDRISSGRRDHDKDKKSSKDDGTRSKHREHKTTDDHHQEKSAPPRRRSTDHDSNDGKAGPDKPATVASEVASTSTANQDTKPEPAEVKSEKETPQKTEANESVVDSCETSSDKFSAPSGSKKEPKSSILVKYDYLKSPTKLVDVKKVPEIEDGCLGFTVEKLPDNPWFEFLRKSAAKDQPKKTTRRSSNNNYLDQKRLDKSLSLEVSKTKQKPKSKTVDSPGEPSDAKQTNGIDEVTAESRAQSIAQQQRYSSEDLYKPRFDFSRSRRRGAAIEENLAEAKIPKPDEMST